MNRTVAAVRALAMSFIALTVAVFVGPALVLGTSDDLRPATETVVGLLSTGLLGLQVVVLVTFMLLLVRGQVASRGRTAVFLVAAAGILAGLNALRLEVEVPWAGFGTEFLLVVWSAAPLGLWAIALASPPGGSNRRWWARPHQWIALAFPLIFLLAALSRVDFRPYTGVAIPTPVLWLLVYLPTLTVVALSLGGWLAFEEHHGIRPTGLAIDGVAVLLSTAIVGTVVSVNSTVAFILSATVTWGSGYQFFPPLALSISLVMGAFAAFVVTAWRLHLRGKSVLGLLLALTAVLSGIFPSAISVLGSLAALQLLWLIVSKTKSA